MKTIILSFFLLVSMDVFCQSIELRAGHSLIPDDYVSLRYQQPTNYAIDFSMKVFLERSRTHGLNYSAFGMEAMAEYRLSIFRIGAGPTIQYDSEPWVYQNFSFSRRLNYGLSVEGSAELILTDVFSITGFINQKYLWNRDLGHFHFVFGVGIKYSFGN